jgi:hypothetical protein
MTVSFFVEGLVHFELQCLLTNNISNMNNIIVNLCMYKNKPACKFAAESEHCSNVPLREFIFNFLKEV